MSVQDLSRLPTEISILIFLQLESPRDLFAFIRTSKNFNQIFNANRATVLSAVIQNAAPAGNIQIAIAACKASAVSKRWWSSQRLYSDYAKSQDVFLRDHPQGRATEGVSLRDSKLVIAIYRLWWISDYFISHFAEKALNLANRSIILFQGQKDLHITASERARIQRAFFRYEVFRRLTPGNFAGYGQTSNADYDRVRVFLGWLSPCEREELLSIQEFLIDFAKGTVRDLQDYIVDQISVASQEVIAKAQTQKAAVETESIKNLETMLDLSGFDVWEHSSVRRFVYLAARGLPFLFWISRLRPNRRILAIVCHNTGSCSPSILEGITNFTDRHQAISPKADVVWPVPADGITLNDPSWGWRWVTSHDLATGHMSMLKRYTLRKMGYIFWDTARLENDWKLSCPAPSLLELKARPYDDDDHQWNKEPSIEERVKDITMPKGITSSKDSTLLARLQPDKEWLDQLDGGWPAPFSSEETEKFDIEYYN